MVAYTFRMPAGIPGTVNRTEIATVEAQFYDMTTPFSAFGLAAKIGSNGKMQPVGAGDAATAVYGWLCRVYPGNPNNDALGTGTPPQTGSIYASGECNILRRGYMMVLLNGATAATKGGPVYIRVAAAATGKPIGGVEAASDSTNTILVPNCMFTGAADASGVTEIAYNI